jgi:hypothetical protein
LAEDLSAILRVAALTNEVQQLEEQANLGSLSESRVHSEETVRLAIPVNDRGRVRR